MQKECAAAKRGSFRPLRLVSANLNAFAVDSQRQKRSTSCCNGTLDPSARLGFDHQCEAAAAARAADFAAERSLPPSRGNNAVNHPRRNCSKIPAAEFPLLAHQAANLIPLVPFECGAHLARDHRDFFEVLRDTPVAIDVPLKNLPVVDAGLPRLARIAKNQAAL